LWNSALVLSSSFCISSICLPSCSGANAKTSGHIEHAKRGRRPSTTRLAPWRERSSALLSAVSSNRGSYAK
jgi:hypothetical protein